MVYQRFMLMSSTIGVQSTQTGVTSERHASRRTSGIFDVRKALPVRPIMGWMS